MKQNSEKETPVKKKILIVDDNEEVTSVVATVLRENPGYQVDVTNDPNEAYTLATSREYDLIISDVDMPSMHGDVLFLHLGVDPNDHSRKRRQPKLLMISGHLDAAELRSTVKFIGGIDYLQKPFDDDTLLAKVETILKTGSTTWEASIIVAALLRSTELAKGLCFIEAQLQEREITQKDILGGVNK